jgi:hypothetical protein
MARKPKSENLFRWFDSSGGGRHQRFPQVGLDLAHRGAVLASLSLSLSDAGGHLSVNSPLDHR